MNTFSLTLSTNQSALTATGEQLNLFDLTEVGLDLLNIYKGVFPSYISIDWGDGTNIEEPEIVTFRTYRTDSIFNEITKGLAPVFLSKTYKHIYKPSSSALIKSMVIKIGIQYINGDITEINHPIKVRTEGYYENIGDIELIDSNILQDVNYSSNFVFRGKVDDYVLELNNQIQGDEETAFIVNDVGKNFEKAEAGGGNVIIDKDDDIIKIVK
jgi:hypothetical protein